MPSGPSGQSRAIATGGDWTTKATGELGGAPGSLGTMLFATAYIVTALAFTGVTYIRCMVWLYQGVIGYPILLAVMAVTLGLFIVPPVMIFRKTSMLPRPGSVAFHPLGVATGTLGFLFAAGAGAGYL